MHGDQKHLTWTRICFQWFVLLHLRQREGYSSWALSDSGSVQGREQLWLPASNGPAANNEIKTQKRQREKKTFEERGTMKDKIKCMLGIWRCLYLFKLFLPTWLMSGWCATGSVMDWLLVMFMHVYCWVFVDLERSTAKSIFPSQSNPLLLRRCSDWTLGAVVKPRAIPRDAFLLSLESTCFVTDCQDSRMISFYE